MNILHFIPQRASTPVEKTLRSAAANAVNREEGSKLNPESLIVKSVWVTDGPRMKRYSPGPMGRASLIRKRSCHLTIVVSDTKGN
jgi:large subunit ribosomal protein L22